MSIFTKLFVAAAEWTQEVIPAAAEWIKDIFRYFLAVLGIVLLAIGIIGGIIAIIGGCISQNIWLAVAGLLVGCFCVAVMLKIVDF